MTSNEVILLDSALSQKRAQLPQSLSDADLFEFFCFEQTLKKYDLSYDETCYGKVGARGDGGIDGLFTFVDGDLLSEDTGLSEVKRGASIDVVVIQAKRSASFSESAIDRINTTISDLFNLENELSDFSSIYNTDVIEKIEKFRSAYIDLAARHPKLTIRYIYASKGSKENISSGVNNRAKILKENTESLFPRSCVEVGFYGARELLDALRVERSYTLQIRFFDHLTRGEYDYIILTSLKDYYEFIIDESGYLRRYIFESNVRDWQGDVEVNKDIRKTLDSDDDMDFWWLNNGITILTSHASIVGKMIALDNVYIVNGLQTTVTIYDYFKEKGSIDDKDKDRFVLLKIIVTGDNIKRDRIIKATNFQIAIPVASLRATDPWQRDIEEYFLSKGLYYDRRKNYYKNIGKPADKIIGIPYLAQAIMAVILKKPDYARARPTSLIKLEDDYGQVFSRSLGFGVYLACASIMKRVDAFIRNYATQYSMRDKTDLKFHILMTLIAKLTGTKDYQVADVEALQEVDIQQDILDETVSEVVESARSYSESQDLPIERIAKTRDFVTYVIERITS